MTTYWGEAANPRPPSRGQNPAACRAHQVAWNLKGCTVVPCPPQHHLSEVIFPLSSGRPRSLPPFLLTGRSLCVSHSEDQGWQKCQPWGDEGRRKERPPPGKNDSAFLPSNQLYPILASMFSCQVLSWGEWTWVGDPHCS